MCIDTCCNLETKFKLETPNFDIEGNYRWRSLGEHCNLRSGWISSSLHNINGDDNICETRMADALVNISSEFGTMVGRRSSSMISSSTGNIRRSSTNSSRSSSSSIGSKTTQRYRRRNNSTVVSDDLLESLWSSSSSSPSSVSVDQRIGIMERAVVESLKSAMTRFTRAEQSVYIEAAVCGKRWLEKHFKRRQGDDDESEKIEMFTPGDDDGRKRFSKCGYVYVAASLNALRDARIGILSHHLSLVTWERTS